MTFDNSPSAIDGAYLTSALVRRASYAGVNGAQGIVQKTDLKVTQLGTPGVGVLVAPGVALVLNKYQTTPNEIYVASNPSVHTIPSGEMPASNPSAKSYIVAVVIGDPDFSQTGHPWMTGADPAVGTELTFQYVRATLIEVSAGATTLSGAYPAYPLARIDVPANTTTITNAMITDLRALAQPRQSQQIYVSPAATWNNGAPNRIPSGAAYADWGANYSPTVKIPTWAKRAIVVCSINGVVLVDASVNISGGIRTQLGAVTGPATGFDMITGRVGPQTDNFQTAGEYDVSGIVGTTVALKVEGFENVPASPTNNQRLALQNGSQMIFDVRFFEE